MSDVNIIRDKRIEKGYSQDTLAKKIGVERSTVAKWETYKSVPATKQLIKLAEIFNCTIR